MNESWYTTLQVRLSNETWNITVIMKSEYKLTNIRLKYKDYNSHIIQSVKFLPIIRSKKHKCIICYSCFIDGIQNLTNFPIKFILFNMCFVNTTLQYILLTSASPNVPLMLEFVNFSPANWGWWVCWNAMYRKNGFFSPGCRNLCIKIGLH